jgi:hypothetical protein
LRHLRGLEEGVLDLGPLGQVVSAPHERFGQEADHGDLICNTDRQDSDNPPPSDPNRTRLPESRPDGVAKPKANC